MIFEDFIKNDINTRYLYSFEFSDNMYIIDNEYFGVSDFTMKHRNNPRVSIDIHQRGLQINFHVDEKFNDIDTQYFVIHDSRLFEPEHPEIFDIFLKCLDSI
jgi:hypothetical protein